MASFNSSFSNSGGILAHSNDKEMNIEPMHGNGLFLQCQLQDFYDIISLSTYQYYVLSAIQKLVFML